MIALRKFSPSLHAARLRGLGARGEVRLEG